MHKRQRLAARIHGMRKQVLSSCFGAQAATIQWPCLVFTGRTELPADVLLMLWSLVKDPCPGITGSQPHQCGEQYPLDDQHGRLHRCMV